MIDPPSHRLVQTLLDLRLCSLADLRRCRGRVRLLSGDLPAFDSVWIDALLQARRLTPWQARMLESPQAQELRVGPCLLIDELGHSEFAVTHLARAVDGRERNVLKLMSVPAERLQATLDQLQHTVALCRGFAHPSLAVPHRTLLHGNRLVAISRYVPGPHLGELLIRRGRFSPDVVQQVARQLVDGLAAFEQRDGVHGEIRLGNVRLTSAGQAVLVDAGIAPAVRPVLSLHSGLSLERCNGLAPELIGTGAAPDSVSDVYSLGCLLWHLLAARPVFPMGDPLARLAAHQTRPVPDIREWAPETPSALADAIRAFTQIEPAARPQSFAEIRQRWGPQRRTTHRRLSRFRKSFNTSAPRIPELQEVSTRKWPLLAALLFVLTGVSLSFLDAGAAGDVLNISTPGETWNGKVAGWWKSFSSQETTRPSHDPPAPKDTAAVADSGCLPLPAPDSQGVILLEQAGPYAWERLDAVGPITIRGATGVSPVVAIDGTPATVVCERLTLENVHFRRLTMLPGMTPVRTPEARETPDPAALLLVQSQMLIVRNSSFVPGHWSGTAVRTYAIGWKAIDPENPLSGIVSLENSAFAGSTSALYLSTVPQTFEARNCLKLGPGPLISLTRHPRPGRQMRVDLKRVTLRDSEALLRIHEPIRIPATGAIAIEANDCVFDLAGDSAALFQWVQPASAAQALNQRRKATVPLRMLGEGSLTRPGVVICASHDPVTGDATELSGLAIELEGLLTDEFEFSGPLSFDPGSAEIESFQAPRRAPFPPGIDARKLSLPAADARIR